jgi:hypothetical protein
MIGLDRDNDGGKWKERDFNWALMELWVLNLLKAVPNKHDIRNRREHCITLPLGHFGERTGPRISRSVFGPALAKSCKLNRHCQILH